ncbi:MmgE/PrpD family protein [Bosea sp. BIWAKO-01]|uniref:MmgE/PrpD family protein n=1 Tax=Bosea sp. BIWAKO-01 TaxID=506668 RepID=UPI00086ED3BA|nr:MmgE/PrpD family protein [Bosea sp. BIWAKO-01]GAU86999.1 immune-responsive protein 1 [Bosea sp. BIWAKO-01]
MRVADVAMAFFAGCGAMEARCLAKAFSENEAAACSAMVRRTECDDINVGSCITPGSVVVPTALAAACENDVALERFDRAVAAGYAVGVRLGRALGGVAALSGGIWPTCFAAPMMAAATAAVARGFDRDGIASAISLAVPRAGGRVGRPAGAPSGRWLAFGDAVASGCRAADAAVLGFQGDISLVGRDWLAAIGGPTHIQPNALHASETDELSGTGFKPFIAARQTINAVVAFQRILAKGVAPEGISRIDIGVPTANAGMVARRAAPCDRLSTIADMRVQIAAAALRPALLYSVERDGEPAADLLDYAARIHIYADAALDRDMPEVWGARVRVQSGGRAVEEHCLVVDGDPGHGDATAMLRAKLTRLAPLADRPLCAALLEPANDEVRRARLMTLWRAMRARLADAPRP